MTNEAVVLERQPWMCRLQAVQRSDERPSAAAPDVLWRALTELGPGPVQWATETGEVLLVELRRASADHGGGPTTSHGTETMLLSMLLQLKERRGADGLEIPDAALDDARTLARSGAPAVLLVEAVWRSHALVQEALLLAARDDDVRDLSLLTRYSERIARSMLDTHESEVIAWADARRSTQRSAVERLVGGGPFTRECAELLGVRAESHHVVAIVTGVGGHPVRVDDPRVGRFVDAVSTRLPRCRILTIDLASEALVWWSRVEPFGPSERESLRATAVPSGLTIGIGDPHAGPRGVARGCTEARRAARIAARTGSRTLSVHEDILLTSVALADPAAARDLVARELAGVLGRDERSDELRRTVLLFLQTGGSRTAVAQQLHIAPTTVAYRVERFGALRGRVLEASRLATWIALDVVDRVPAVLEEVSGSGE